MRIVAFYVTEHADGGKWLPGYYNPLLEKQAWQLLGQLARDYWVQFRTEGISLHHAAARVAGETASHYPRMLDGRAVRDEWGNIISDGGPVVPGSSWEAVVARIERAAKEVSKK